MLDKFDGRPLATLTSDVPSYSSPQAATIGGRRWCFALVRNGLLAVDLESYNPTLDTKERFTLAVGTEGEWKGVPVYVKYQPKWWFKAEGVIDVVHGFVPVTNVDCRLE